MGLPVFAVGEGLLAATGARAGTAGVTLSAGVGEGVAAGVSSATGAGAGAAGVGVADTLVGDGKGLWREASGAAGVAGASARAAAVGLGLGEAGTAVVLAMTGEAAGVGAGTGGRGTLSSSPVAESRTAMDLAGWTATEVTTVVPNAGELTVIG